MGLIGSVGCLDVKFEVLGAPYSLLSVALPASSVLYSRRGTLVGVNGRAENVKTHPVPAFSEGGGRITNGYYLQAVSTLSLLEPIRRAFLRIPFLYQKVSLSQSIFKRTMSKNCWFQISSTSPLTCLISTNSPNTTFGVIELDGKVDWMVTQSDALLAWTGHSISAKPSVSPRMVFHLHTPS